MPTREVTLIRHFTLAEDDLALVAKRKHPETKLGLALQLCALRYPGRLLRPGELIPAEPLAFIAEQVGVPPDRIAAKRWRSAADTKIHTVYAMLTA